MAYIVLQEMKTRAEIWNVLHDGGIESIVGDIPGDVTITVGIQYLCRMFEPAGESISLHLSNCTKLSMNIWDDNSTTSDIERILSTDLEILSTESEDVPVQVVTTHGVLELDFEAFSLFLDNGRKISFDELLKGCEDYWERWETEAKQRKITEKQNKSEMATPRKPSD